jgi:16S rRNA (cytosine967-C5)-methyltransferase
VRSGATFGDACDRYFAGLDERERRFAYELAAGVLRRQSGLDAVLDLARADRRLHDILRLGVYQLRHSRVPPHAAVSTSVDLARDAAGEGGARYVNRALRAVARDPGRGEQGTVSSHPPWLVDRWRARFGERETQALVAWNDTKPPLVLQPARWDQATLRARLLQAGLSIAEAPFGCGVRVTRGQAAPGSLLPPKLPGFAEGGWIVQDAAQALVCRFAAIPPGHRVYDACAAPGGKAITLETLGARVAAGDARRDRFRRLVETTRRAGVAIRLLLADLLAAPFGSASVDAVFLDAPCTATGTMARHPDARWRVTAGSAARAAARQGALLAAAARLVRPDGLLVYATCSLETEENEEVVNAFLARHPAFDRAPVTGSVADALLTECGDLRCLPQRHGADGAYAARLRRSA